MDPGKLLQIGLFSKLSQLSVRMLRHYQQHGLLVPAHVDPFTGYRYYRTGQLHEAERIRQLRDAGFVVTRIAAALAAMDDPPRLSALLDLQRERLDAQSRQLQLRQSALERLIHSMREIAMHFDVRQTLLPAMTVAALRHTVATYASEGELWQRLMPLVARSGAEPAAAGMAGATFHDEEYREADVDVEVWLQVAAPFAAAAPLQCRSLAQQRVVTATLAGGYERMGQATAAIGTYIAENGLTTGPMFNIYRVSPAQDPDPANWVTDVCFPIVDAD
ncbi:MerR family transcriptional regulator [Stenotrophomonas sp. MMGLT7]|uniref:MerR family transcriptional regulator n=1 Tax=Stenotrophomonas sp. MMGLT7 TaxID=2901227 RepID=UPI001E3BD248|nr:MerR family transcriptional regulator [Stenotrophomonas sp. MMGLT7]MCD7097367.1 MerR family transcriptional regulator [Stenotrophomonas sp. MMGLT7]